VIATVLRKNETGLKTSKQEGGAQMNTVPQTIRALSVASTITFFMFAWPIAMATSAEGLKVSLSGDQEVPPVSTSASGNGTITVSPNKSVTGNITVSGMEPTAAHIHEAARGENGPVIIPLTKSSDTTWSIPAGAKLTDAQYKSYLAGNLYVNVHSAAHKDGEIRAQLSPK
jgi:CHRD domain